MKLFHSATSPYARKVLVVAHETGRRAEIETVMQATGVLDPPADLMAVNPLAKVPALVTDEGEALYDSRVICEYLDAGSAGVRVFPASGKERWTALVQQALGDGLLDAALLIRLEVTLRPEAMRFPAWQEGQTAKIVAALGRIEETAATLDGPTIGAIAYGCALGYLDFRFADLDWRARCPAASAWYAQFSRRPSMVATAPPG